MLPCVDGPSSLFGVGLEVSARSEDHTHSILVVVKYNTLHVRLDEDVEIRELSTLKLGVDIRVGRVRQGRRSAGHASIR